MNQRESLLAFLKTVPDADVKQVMTALDLKRTQASDLLAKALYAGQVERSGEPRRFRYHLPKPKGPVVSSVWALGAALQEPEESLV